MRVTGGTARGTPLRSPTTQGVRPTTDRVRLALFNILAPQGLEGVRVVDVFAGTGSLGIEALSRGAAHVIFIERDHRQAQDIRTNLEAARLAERATVLTLDAERAVERLDGPFAYVLMDPPYSAPFPQALAARIADRGLLADDAMLVVGHSSRVAPPDHCGSMHLSADRRYGDSALAFYGPGEAA